MEQDLKQYDSDSKNTNGKILTKRIKNVSKSKNKINARRHIVLVALNQAGLNNIYKIVSNSHQGDNFYRYPRLDYEMLEKYGGSAVWQGRKSPAWRAS